MVLHTYLVYNTVVRLCHFFSCCGGKVLLRLEKKSSSPLSGGLCCCVSFWFWREIGFGCTYYYVFGVPYSCFLLWRESFITTGKKSSSRLSGGLCCCVSFWFWQEIGFGCTYYSVLGVPYSCGVVLVFLVLAGNIFWCYVRT